MKKYLLVALLAMGATAFGAVTENSDTAVSLPVRAKGEIVEAGKQLIIEANTAGMAGDVMEFNFGAIVKPDSTALTKAAEPGKFTVKRADGTALVDSTGTTPNKYSAMKIGIGKNATEAASQTESKSNPAGTGITIDYVLNGDGTDLADKAVSYVGYVGATVKVENTAEVGSFVENANRVYVTVTKE